MSKGILESKGSASEMAEQLSEIYNLITETNQTENK
jgi:hypothetical protein